MIDKYKQDLITSFNALTDWRNISLHLKLTIFYIFVCMFVFFTKNIFLFLFGLSHLVTSDHCKYSLFFGGIKLSVS